MTGKMDERTLAARLAEGSTEALGIMIEKYSGYVRTVAYNFSRGFLSPEDIDDITADTFCKLWNCRANINADIGLRSYLSAAVRNLVKDRFKRMPPPAEDISELDIPSELLTEDMAELHEITQCLYEALERLPEDDRELFIRFYYYGEKASRIAAEKGVSKGAVDQRLHRVRKKLRDYLNERGHYYV